ncbi:MAG: ATP-binding protein, partial [Campylobacterales bacterium]|nr:ATP-binding protein [Campylobacterales bacterium]
SKLGRKNKAIVSFTDITDSIRYREMLADSAKELEKLVEKRTEELVKANENLLHKERLLIEQSKMAEMGEMIGAIAHQWKQPLNSLALLVQDIPDRVEYDEMDLEYAETFSDDCMEQIDYMNQTIEDFRNFFKPSEYGEFSILESVDSALSLLKKQFEKLKINIIQNYQVDESAHSVGLINEFKQVIVNILNNAKDVLFERKVEDKEIEIIISKDEKQVKIQICDNAGGVPEEILPRIFDSYFSTKGENGTGIGLEIAKTIIDENMKGKLSAYNTDKGAVFQIELDLV